LLKIIDFLDLFEKVENIFFLIFHMFSKKIFEPREDKSNLFIIN